MNPPNQNPRSTQTCGCRFPRAQNHKNEAQMKTDNMTVAAESNVTIENSIVDSKVAGTEKQAAVPTTAVKHEVHPVARIFPPMEEDALIALAEDIQKNGQHHPIALKDGMVIDGVNRLKACELLGVEPRFTEWNEQGDLAAWVMGQNLHRRHLEASQRAAVAAEMVEYEKKNGKKSREKGKAVEKAAKAMNVSPGYVNEAVKLKDEAPEEFEKVKEGKKTISEARKEKAESEPRHLNLVETAPHATAELLKQCRGKCGDNNALRALIDQAHAAYQDAAEKSGEKPSLNEALLPALLREAMAFANKDESEGSEGRRKLMQNILKSLKAKPSRTRKAKATDEVINEEATD